jgi:hypothetical protein
VTRSFKGSKTLVSNHISDTVRACNVRYSALDAGGACKYVKYIDTAATQFTKINSTFMDEKTRLWFFVGKRGVTLGSRESSILSPTSEPSKEVLDNSLEYIFDNVSRSPVVCELSGIHDITKYQVKSWLIDTQKLKLRCARKGAMINISSVIRSHLIDTALELCTRQMRGAVLKAIGRKRAFHLKWLAKMVHESSGTKQAKVLSMLRDQVCTSASQHAKSWV